MLYFRERHLKHQKKKKKRPLPQKPLLLASFDELKNLTRHLVRILESLV